MSFHVNIDLSRLSETEYPDAVGIIISALNLNAAVYPSLPVPTSTLTTQIGAYNTIKTTPIYLSKAADLAAARETVDVSLRANATYINTTAAGDLSKLEKSGYPVSKANSPVGPLAQTKIEASAIVGSASPGFDIDITKVEHANGYLVVYLPVASIGPAITSIYQWNWAYLPKHTGQITGLLPHTPYRLISIGLGTDPTLNFSDPIDRTTN